MCYCALHNKAIITKYLKYIVTFKVIDRNLILENVINNSFSLL